MRDGRIPQSICQASLHLETLRAPLLHIMAMATVVSAGEHFRKLWNLQTFVFKLKT